MANKTMQQLRGTAAALAARNPVPLAGQMVVEKDTNKFKFGNGSSHYNDLPYGKAESVGFDSLGLVRDSSGYLCQMVEEDDE